MSFCPTLRNGVASIGIMLLTVISLSAAPIQASYYAAPNGSGTLGTKEAPCSLTGVRDLVRSANKNMTGDIVVYLRGGIYQLDAPFQLIENDQIHDSGSNGFKIVYKAFPGETPVISGSIPITGWTLFDKEKNIYRGKVPPGTQSRQFFVNGRRAERARGELRPTNWFKTETGWGCLDQSIAKWKNPSDIEIVSRSSWKHLRCGVASIKIDTITPLAKPKPRVKPGQPSPTPIPVPTPVQCARVDMKTPGWFNASKSPHPGPPANGGGTQQMNEVEWVENAFELLTKPGQWYLDRKEETLYYIPRPGEDPSVMDAELAVLEKVLDVRGSDFSHRIHDINFEGLTFQNATWLQPNGDQGYADNQAGVTWVNIPPVSCKTPGGVSVQYGERVGFLRNVVTHMGGAGIDFGHGPQHCDIIGNCLYDISGNGIFLGEVDDFASTNPVEWCEGNKIENNYIRDVGVEFEDQVGICTGYTRHLSLAHNELTHLPYSGISVGWGWGKSGYSHQNAISSNKVSDFMNILGDGGGIYTLGNQGTPEEKTLWIGNYITGGKHAQGMYSDEGSGYMEISSNVVTHVGANWMNIWCGWIHDISVHDNFADKSNANNHGTNCLITNNVMTEKADHLSEAAQSIANHAGLEPVFADITNAIPLPVTIIVNDQESSIRYTGKWMASGGRKMGDYDDDIHATAENGATASLSFKGIGVDYLTEFNTDEGEVNIYVDGALVKSVDCKSPTREVQQIGYHQEWDKEGNHEIKIEKKSGSYMGLDGFKVYHPQPKP
ncbi:MAG: right-handed parallel beta-helix repeat-containing protein [bacterium]